MKTEQMAPGAVWIAPHDSVIHHLTHGPDGSWSASFSSVVAVGLPYTLLPHSASLLRTYDTA